MPKKGTLCHAATGSETCEGVSHLHGLVLDGGGGGGGGGGREKVLGVFLGGNIVFPCVN